VAEKHLFLISSDDVSFKVPLFGIAGILLLLETFVVLNIVFTSFANKWNLFQTNFTSVNTSTE